MRQLKFQSISDMKKNILQTSTNLFLNQGYNNTTIRQIAEACGIGRGHLYYYFKKKEDILIHIFKQFIKKIYCDVIENSDDKTEVLLSYAIIQCIYIYTIISNENLFRIYLEASNIEIVRRSAQNALSELCKKKAESMNYDVDEKDIYFSIIIAYSGECELLKRFYHHEENLDIDSIIRSIVSTRLLLLNIIGHKETNNIVNQALIEAKCFNYDDIVEKLYFFEF